MKKSEFLTLNKYGMVKSDLLGPDKVCHEIKKEAEQVFQFIILFYICVSWIMTDIYFGQGSIAELITKWIVSPLTFFFALLAITKYFKENQHCEDVNYLRDILLCSTVELLGMSGEELVRETQRKLVNLALNFMRNERLLLPDDPKVIQSKNDFAKAFEITKRLGIHNKDTWKPFFREAYAILDAEIREEGVFKTKTPA